MLLLRSGRPPAAESLPIATGVRTWASGPATPSSVRRTRMVVVLDSWCVTGQNRSPPTFAWGRTSCVQASRLPTCRGPGPGENDDWLGVAGRTEATGANKACGQRTAEAIERSRVLGQGRYILQPQPELGLCVKYRMQDAGCSTRWSVGKWGGGSP